MSANRGSKARATALAAVVPLMFLAACSSGTGASGGEDGQIRMMVNLTDNLDQAYWEKLVKPFEDKTGLKVKIEGPTGKSVAESFPQQLAAGTAPDVIQSIFPDDDTAPELLDLSGQDWAKGTPMFDEYAIGDAHYAVGVGTQTQSLVYYNKSAFEKAGITAAPTTWAELADDLGKLKKAGYTPMQTAGDYQTGLQLQQIYHPALNQIHPKWQSDVKDKKLTVGETYKPAFQLYSDWIDAGYIAKSDVGLSPSQADGNFVAGKVGLYTNGSWFAATLAKAGKLPSRSVCSPLRPPTARATRACRAPPWPTRTWCTRVRRTRTAPSSWWSSSSATPRRSRSSSVPTGCSARTPMWSRPVSAPRSSPFWTTRPRWSPSVRARATSGCP